MTVYFLRYGERETFDQSHTNERHLLCVCSSHTKAHEMLDEHMREMEGRSGYMQYNISEVVVDESMW